MYNLFTVNVNHFVKMCEFCLSLIPRRGMVPPFPFSCSTHTQTHTLSVGRCGDKQESDHSSPDCLIISATTRHPGLVTHPAVIQPLWGSHTSPRTPQHTPSAKNSVFIVQSDTTKLCFCDIEVLYRTKRTNKTEFLGYRGTLKKKTTQQNREFRI